MSTIPSQDPCLLAFLCSFSSLQSQHFRAILHVILCDSLHPYRCNCRSLQNPKISMASGAVDAVTDGAQGVTGETNEEHGEILGKDEGMLEAGSPMAKEEAMDGEEEHVGSEEGQKELAMVPFEAREMVGEEDESAKDGWEAARAWLWSLPRRRNVMYKEFEDWLQANKHKLSREIITMPRAHLFRYLVSQHKLMRRAEQEGELELVEPPTARFRRSEKWRPVYVWLESLDSGSVVGSKAIDAWLSRNPSIKEDLLGKHTRHHLFHYIQKCHSNILKKRRKLVLNGSVTGNNEKKKKKRVRKLFKAEVQLGHAGGTVIKRIDSTMLGTESSQLESRVRSENNHGFNMQNLETFMGFIHPSQMWNRTIVENGPGDARDSSGRNEVENITLALRAPDGVLHADRDSLQTEPKDSQLLIVAHPKGVDTKLFLEEQKMGRVSMDRAEAWRRYEILSELRTKLLEQIIQTREQMRTASAQENTFFLDRPSTSATPFADDPNQPASSGAVLGSLFDGQSMSNEDFDGRSRRRSRDSGRSLQENAGSSLMGQRSRSNLDLRFGKKRRKGKEKVDNAVLSWSYSEIATDSSSCSKPGYNSHFEKGPPDTKLSIRGLSEKATSSQNSGDESKKLKVVCSPVKCLQERERGDGIGYSRSPFQMVGRRGCNRWKSFIQGWDSLEKQFEGCAVTLQRKAFSTWLPCWSAYTSSVAVAAPLGMIDQGVQKVLDVRFHPHNLPQLVCSSNAAPNELLLYDLLSGKATELVGHNCQIQAVEYVANGRYIASCGSNLVKIWDSTTAACLHTLGPGPWDETAIGHRKKIHAMAVNREQSCLVATSGGIGDSQLLLWDVNRGELTCDLNRDLRRQYSSLPCMDALEFCHQNLLICGSDSTSGGPAIVQIWDVNAPQTVTSFPANDSYITSLKTDPAGTTIASGAGDGSVALFDLRTCGGIIRLPLGSNCEVTAVSFSPCGTYFQASSTANRTFVWDTRMLPMEPGPRPTENPLELADSVSRRIRALHCLSHGTPMPTSENAGQMPGYVDEGDQGVNDARWFHDTSVLVTVCGNGSIAMWDMSLGDPCIRHMISHSRCINTIAIAPNDKYICSGGDDQKVVLYQNTREKAASGWRLTHPLLEEPVD